MANEMVMRSVYLRPDEDAQLRQLAFDLNVTKSDLIRSAISLKLVDWLQSDSKELVLEDIGRGRRSTRAERAERERDARREQVRSAGSGAAKKKAGEPKGAAGKAATARSSSEARAGAEG